MEEGKTKCMAMLIKICLHHTFLKITKYASSIPTNMKMYIKFAQVHLKKTHWPVKKTVVRPFLHLLINSYDTFHQIIYISWMCMHHSWKKSFSKSVTPKGRLSPFIWGKKRCILSFTFPFVLVQFSSVQFIHSGVSDALRPQWTAACQASLSITNFLKLKITE